MNQIILIGNIAADIEERITADGKSVANFTIAVDRPYNSEKTDFIRCSAWGALAQNCAKYLAKGKKVAVQGSLHIDTYDKEGLTRYAPFIRADRVEFLSPRQAVQQALEQKHGALDDFMDIPEDIPFS